MNNDPLSDFRKELQELINRYSLENASNTPDFILCNYLVQCLSAFNSATIEREKWYGIINKFEEREILKDP